MLTLESVETDPETGGSLRMSLEELRQSGIEPHGATVSALEWYGKDKV